MEGTKIYFLLKSISIPVLNRFNKFIKSPYFNNNEKLTILTDIVINDIKGSKAVDSKLIIWKKVGFNEDYSDQKFRKLCNDLTEKFENFLIIEQLEEEKMLKNNLLLKAIKEQNHSKLIEKHISKSSLAFERSLDNSSNYLLQKYEYNKTIHGLKTMYKKQENKNKYINSESFKELSQQLDAFYAVEKLRQAIDFLTRSNQYNIEFNVDISETIKIIQRGQLQNEIAINIYQLMYQILTIQNSESKYFELKELAKKEIYHFPKIEQGEIFDALFSYCVRKVNKGNVEFLREYLDLNDWGIREELILKNGILSTTSFRNYVVIGLRISEYDKVDKYIYNNIKLLNPDKQKNALNFNLARLNFYKKDYNVVIQNINLVTFDDIWYNLNSKILLMATYFELDESYVLESMFDSYRSFLRRETALDNKMKKRYLDFINYLKKLVTHSNKIDKIILLKNKLVTESNVVNKDWLLEKMDEIIKR